MKTSWTESAPPSIETASRFRIIFKPLFRAVRVRRHGFKRQTGYDSSVRGLQKHVLIAAQNHDPKSPKKAIGTLFVVATKAAAADCKQSAPPGGTP